jgi:hypothetical protein
MLSDFVQNEECARETMKCDEAMGKVAGETIQSMYKK